LAANARFFMGDLAQAETAAHQAHADAVRLGDEVTVCLAMQTLALAADARGLVDQAVDTAEQAVTLAGRLQNHPRAGFLYPHLYLGLVLIDADRLDAATAALQEGRRLAEERGTTLWLPLYHFALAHARAMAGAWGDTVAEAEAGLALADEVGTRLHAPFLHGIQAWVAVQRGDLATAQARLIAAVDEFVALADDSWNAAEAQGGVMEAGPQWPVEYGNWIEGLLFEAQGGLSRGVDPRVGRLGANAALCLEQAWDLAAPIRYFLSSRLFGPDLVRVALAMGDRDRANAVTAELEEGARRAPVATARGAAQMCRGLVDDDPDVLLAAVNAYRAGPRPAESAWACEAAGMALARAGRTAEAIGLLEDARIALESLGATIAVARIEAELRSLGVRHRRPSKVRRATVGWDSLTDTENEVVRHVTQGLTNPQVGARMFISRRTVETHLAHVFQKLGLTTRAQLTAEAVRRTSPTPVIAPARL
jgi:DNA-binding CsgD family transcriptional regulator